jgi:sigma 54 modulation/S30EA-like ribosomal protein
VQIFVNSDARIRVDDRVISFVQDEADRALGRHKDRLTRVDFHLSDVNSHKFGLLDKRCVLEAHPAGRQPLVVTVDAPNVRSAVHGAVAKLQTALERFFGRTSRRSRARHQEPPPAECEAESASLPLKSSKSGSGPRAA